MRTLLIILLASITLSAQAPQSADTTKTTIKPKQETTKPEPKKEATVLICNSKSSYAYHKYRCRGLNNCKSGVLTVTLSKAKEMGRTPCKNCYK